MSASNGRIHILVLEEDQKTASLIEQILAKNGYVVDVATESKTAVAKGLAQDYQLTMADICNHGDMGIEFLHGLRAGAKKIPFLALSEHDNTPERMRALQEGADDFLLKPFGEEELLARVQTILWRADMSSNSLLQARDLTMDVDKRIVRRSSRTLRLTRTEFSLLELFLKNKNVVLPRHFIRERVWGSKLDDGTNIVDVYINYLRTSVDKDFSPKLIHTVRGKGFVLRAD
jgi:two-component system copper resistance phosphate regulon response regulator CusR